MQVTIGGKSWEIPPPDYHIRRGKRAQLYMRDLQERLRDYFQFRCTAVRNWRYRHYMSAAQLSKNIVANGDHYMSPYMVGRRLVVQDIDMSISEFDSALRGMGISIRELIHPDETMPTSHKSSDSRLEDLEQHMRNMDRLLDRFMKYADEHINYPQFHRVADYVFRLQEEIRAICGLYGLTRTDEGDKPEGPEELPKY